MSPGLNVRSRRSVSASVVAVIVVIIVIVAGLAYIVAKYGSGAAPPGTSAPRPPPTSLLSQYLGGSWTLNGSESAVIYPNSSSGTAKVEFLNGTTTTEPLSNFSGLPSSYVSEIAAYQYTGMVNSQPYFLSIMVIDFTNSTMANGYYESLSGYASSRGATTTQVSGAQATVGVTPEGAIAVALKGNYVVLMDSNMTSVSTSAWEGLLSAVLGNTS